MKATIVALILNIAISARGMEPEQPEPMDTSLTHRRESRAADKHYLAKIMCDLLVQFYYLGATGPEINDIIAIVPRNAWELVKRKDVQQAMLEEDELDYTKVQDLQEKLATKLEQRFSLIELAAIIARLEDNGVSEYLLDGSI